MIAGANSSHRTRENRRKYGNTITNMASGIQRTKGPLGDARSLCTPQCRWAGLASQTAALSGRRMQRVVSVDRPRRGRCFGGSVRDKLARCDPASIHARRPLGGDFGAKWGSLRRHFAPKSASSARSGRRPVGRCGVLSETGHAGGRRGQ